MHILKHFSSFVLAAFCLCGHGGNLAYGQSTDIEGILGRMSLHEKVCMMFSVRPEALSEVDSTKEVSGFFKEKYREYPVGGFTLFGKNISDPEQLLRFTSDLHALEGHPLLSIDEEGGRVLRIAPNESFHLKKIPPMEVIAGTGDTSEAFKAGAYIGEYLNRYGFDIDFAPVADVNTNPENPVIGARAFGSDPSIAGEMVSSYVKGLNSKGIKGCLKHFPGHGDTKGDTHKGYSKTDKSWEEIRDCEMLPFKAGILSGVPLVMVAHIAAPKVTGSDIPSTMSEKIITGVLRGELGFKGIIITDSMGMGAIMQNYSVEESTLEAVKAGCDIILMPKDLALAVKAIEDAVEKDELSEKRIDESVRRILELKNSCRN